MRRHGVNWASSAPRRRAGCPSWCASASDVASETSEKGGGPRWKREKRRVLWWINPSLPTKTMIFDGTFMVSYPLVIQHGVLENGPYRTWNLHSVQGIFQLAMLDYQRVTHKNDEFYWLQLAKMVMLWDLANRKLCCLGENWWQF